MLNGGGSVSLIEQSKTKYILECIEGHKWETENQNRENCPICSQLNLVRSEKKDWSERVDFWEKTALTDAENAHGLILPMTSAGSMEQ